MLKNKAMLLSALGTAMVLMTSVSFCAFGEENISLEITENDEGFGCIVMEDGTIYWQAGTDSCKDLLSMYGIDKDSSYAAIHVIPDSEEEYPYLYPENEWKMVAYQQIPDWFNSDSESIVWNAFEEWKDEVYSVFDYVAVRELTADETINAAPGADYEPTAEDIENFLEYININNSLCTYIKTSVRNSIDRVVGTSVSSDVWNYVNRDVSEDAKQAADVGSLLRSMGVSNVGVVQNDFSGALTGYYFDIDEWLYYMDDSEGYPYECAAYLWQHGLCISEDSDDIWRLHSAADGTIYYEIADEDVSLKNAFACVADSEGNIYWDKAVDYTGDIIKAYDLDETEIVEIQVKPIIDKDSTEFSLPDGNNPDVTRYFPYLDDSAEWTINVLSDVTPDWFDSEIEDAVMAAFDEWKNEVYGSFDFDAAQQAFTEDNTTAEGYDDSDIELLKSWATAWHGICDDGMDPTAALKLSGYEAVGSSLWDDIDEYLLAAWRVQHTACPGDVVQAGYFAEQGIYDQQEYDHEIGDIVGDSVSDVMEAVPGYYFFDSSDWTWEYYNGDIEGYPFAAGVELVIKGLVPYTDGTNWYLCTGEDADILFCISEEELLG